MLTAILIGLTVCMALALAFLASRALLRHIVDRETAMPDEAVDDPAASTSARAQPQPALSVYQMQRRFRIFGAANRRSLSSSDP